MSPEIMLFGATACYVASLALIMVQVSTQKRLIEAQRDYINHQRRAIEDYQHLFNNLVAEIAKLKSTEAA